MSNQQEGKSSILTWQRGGGWIVIACAIFMLFLLLLDILGGESHVDNVAEQGLSGLGFLVLGTGLLLSRRRRTAVILLILGTLLLSIALIM